MRAACPFCHHPHEIARSGSYGCGRCGGTFAVELPPEAAPPAGLPVAAPPQEMGPLAPPPGRAPPPLPAEPTLPTGFARAIASVIASPSRFFRAMPREGGYERPAFFAAMCYLVSSPAGYLAIWLGARLFGLDYEELSGLKELARLTGESAPPIPFGALLGWGVLCSPIAGVVAVLVTAAALHAGTLVFGGRTARFEATFRVVAHAAALQVLNWALVPIALGGALAGSLSGAPDGARLGLSVASNVASMAFLGWAAAVAAIGLREVHGLSTLQALGTVLLPLGSLFCCAAGIGLVGVATLR